jgi:hypothetical protein
VAAAERSGRRGPPLEVLLDRVADPADATWTRRLSSGAVLMVASPDPRLPRSARTGSCNPCSQSQIGQDRHLRG